MFALPDQFAKGTMHLRYEDIAQDGRPRVGALPVALGVVWRGVSMPKEARTSLAQAGILPILTRFRVEAEDGPFAIERPFDVSGSFRLAHAKAASGEVERLFLDIEAELTAPIGRTNFPPPENAGAMVRVGSVLAEHTFTRPFAPAGERKVTHLPVGDLRVVPPRERASLSPAELLEPPEGAIAIEADFSMDPTRFAMGITHTDSNQHVNSLVYPALFEECALRRLHALGKATSVLARSLDVRYRRPSFAGDVLSCSLRTFSRGGSIECVGAIFGEGETDLTKARCTVRMILR